jgi:hypothetical protein
MESPRSASPLTGTAARRAPRSGGKASHGLGNGVHGRLLIARRRDRGCGRVGLCGECRKGPGRLNQERLHGHACRRETSRTAPRAALVVSAA